MSNFTLRRWRTSNISAVCLGLTLATCPAWAYQSQGPSPDSRSNSTETSDAAPEANDGQAAQKAANPTAFTGPVVARSQLNLVLEGEVVDTIHIGDLLTVLSVRETSYVIQTHSGHKGAVLKNTVATLGESMDVYSDLITRTPDEGRLYTLRAGAYFAAGKNKEAVADYDKAIELGYDAAHAYTSRGLFHAAMGAGEKALADFSTAIEKDAEDAVPLINRAGVYVSLGDYRRAVADYTSAIKLRADDAGLYAQRAVAHKAAGKLAKSLKDYDRAIKLQPTDSTFVLGRGFVKFQMKDHEGAVADFSKAFELAPRSAVAVNNRGYNYSLLGDEAKAVRDYRRATELAPRYLLAWRNLAWLLVLTEDVDIANPTQAIDASTVVCELTEYKDFSDLTLLAAAYASAAEFETARGWQEKATDVGDADQKRLSEQILDLYADDKSLDPRLLDGTDSQ